MMRPLAVDHDHAVGGGVENGPELGDLGLRQLELLPLDLRPLDLLAFDLRPLNLRPLVLRQLLGRGGRDQSMRRLALPMDIDQLALDADLVAAVDGERQRLGAGRHGIADRLDE